MDQIYQSGKYLPSEEKRNLEIAKSMLLKCYPLDDIVTLTGLSIKEVEQLIQK